jgi:uncharacterized protein
LQPSEPPARPNWRLIALFYGLSFTWVCALGLVLWLLGAQMFAGNAKLVFQLTVAFLYMPAPLAAALIVERVAHRKPLITHTFDGFGRKLPRLLLTYVGVVAAMYLADLAFTFLLGNVLHVPGVGALTFTGSGIIANLRAALPVQAQANVTAAKMPPALALYPIAVFAALTAGLSINGLFAFGEEYGWRGFLMDELRSLGPVRANLLTGVMWGLWHAPLILLGFNYGPDRLLGILMMCAFTTPLAFIFWYARDYTGSLLAPALLHGAFNAFAGFFLLFVAGRQPLIAAPVGLVGALALTCVAVGMSRLRPSPAVTAETPADESLAS